MKVNEVDFNKVVGLVLRWGVIASFALISVGSILLFAEGQTGYYPLSTAVMEVHSSNAFLVGIGPLGQGLATAKPFAIIELGLLILFGTPVSRVFISIFLFFGEGRYIFVLITLAVLALLLFSMFVVGPIMSG